MTSGSGVIGAIGSSGVIGYIKGDDIIVIDT